MRKFIPLFLGLCALGSIGLGCRGKSAVEERSSSLRIMSYNIRIGIGMDDTLRLDRCAKVINEVRPDFVGLQEVDSVAERSGWVDQAKELSRLTGMYPIFAPATERSKGLYGIAALTREKPLSYHNIALPGKEEPRTFLIVEYEDYFLCDVHMSLNAESRKESVALIREQVKKMDKPVVVTGDFNMRPGSEEFRLMDEDWTLLSDTSIRTFPSDTPRVTLDYIFGFGEQRYEVSDYVVVDEPMASDHLPIYVDLTLPEGKK